MEQKKSVMSLSCCFMFGTYGGVIGYHFPDNSLQNFHYTDLIKFNGFDSVLTL